MSTFWELVKFEYKKILCRRSTVITLLAGVLLTAFTCVGTLLGNHNIEGEVLESNYEGMVKDRENIRKLAGRAIDADLLAEAVEAYSRIPPVDGIYCDTREYQEYARPYFEIYYLIRKVFGADSLKEVASIDRERLDEFYAIRQRAVEDVIKNTAMSAVEKENSISLSRKVSTPFIYDYTGGYRRLLAQMQTTAFLVCLICSICISPLFAGEYSNGMGDIVYSSRFGRNRMLYAKLFTGVSFTVLLGLVLTAVSFVTVMGFFGWDGSDAPVQIHYPLSILPLTMGQAAMQYCAMILAGNLLSSAIAMTLSARLRSPFTVLTIMTAITILPAFLRISENMPWLYHLSNFIPIKMFELNNVINVWSINIFGLIVQPYELMILVAVLASAALLPAAYRYAWHGY